MELLRRFPNVLIIDSACKTNKYNVPLMNVIRVTPLNDLFMAALCSARSETATGFNFVLTEVKAVYDKLEVAYPRVAFADKDNALRRSLLLIFPDMHRLLCLWHINKKHTWGIQRRFQWRNR